jgi:hypothetical protein
MKDWVDALYRCVYIPAGRNVPVAVWSTDEIWLLRATYRTRDLRAVKIEGKPVPSPKASGLQAWSWQSSEPLIRPAFETTIGVVLMLGAGIFLIRRRSPDVSSHFISLVGDAAHR